MPPKKQAPTKKEAAIPGPSKKQAAAPAAKKGKEQPTEAEKENHEEDSKTIVSP
jgi:hypothetical protein